MAVCFIRRVFRSAICNKSILPTCLIALLLTANSSTAAQETLSKLSESEIDSSALTLPGNAPYVSAISGLAFQQDALSTFAGWQYAAYYDGSRHVAIARRLLPHGVWQVVRFSDYKFTSNDAHNTISLGICAKDGTIHLAFDHHNDPLHYRVSKPGAATHPEKAAWDASLFGPIHSDLEPGKPIAGG